jgi:hypothetical protein
MEFSSLSSHHESLEADRRIETRRVLWAVIGVPAAYAISCCIAAVLIGHWPQQGYWFLPIPVVTLIACLYTGARSLFLLLSLSTPIKWAICCAYIIVAFYFVTFLGLVAAFSFASLFGS